VTPEERASLKTLADMMDRQASITQDPGEARGRNSRATMLRNFLGEPPPLPDMKAPPLPKIDPEDS
jgi:hypothetical protein